MRCNPWRRPVPATSSVACNRRHFHLSSVENLTITEGASLLLGGAVALVAVAIFAIVLRRLEESKPGDAIKRLYELVGLVLGAGLTDHILFDYMLQSHAIEYYISGFSAVFLILGLVVFFDWRRQ